MYFIEHCIHEFDCCSYWLTKIDNTLYTVSKKKKVISTPLSLSLFNIVQLVMELVTRWRDVVIDAVELSVVRRHGHKSSVGVSLPELPAYCHHNNTDQ